MHISNIAHTLRGLNFRQDLSNRVIITGEYATGKTSVIDAIALALTASVPRLGSSGAKLEPVINGNKATSSITLSDGTIRSFEITKGAKGQISKKSSNKDALSPIILDASLFTGAKPAERIAMIQSAVGFKGNLIDILAATIGKVGASQSLMSRSKDPGEWIAETTDLLATEAKEQSSIAERLAAAIQTSAIESDAPQAIYDAKAHRQATDSHRQALIKLGGLDAEIKAIERVIELGEPIKPDKDRSTEIADVTKHLADLRAKRSDLCRQIAIAESNGKKIEEWKSQTSGVCLTCGSKQEHWSPFAPRISQIDIEAVSKYISDAEKLIAECPSDSDYDDLEFAIMEAEQEDRLENDWALYNQAKAKHEAARSSLAEKEGSHLGLTKVIETLEAEIALYKQQESEAATIQAEAAAAARRKSELTDAQTRSENAKAALKALKAEVGNQSNKLMGPILKIANTITKGILPAPMEASNFTLGYSRDGAWVPLDGFSGVERAVALAGIQAALLSDNDIKTIILDEAQMVIGSNFLTNIDQLIEDGVIEQAIVVGSNLGKHIPTGWQSIILTK